MIKKFSTGCIKSKTDERDILLSQVQAPIPLHQLPDNYIIPYQLTILDQNSYPACVGFSSASLKAEKERREQNLIDFDGLWLYQQCKKIDGAPKQDGTQLRAAMKVLKDTGAKPLNQSGAGVAKYKIGGYAQVDDLSFNGLKSAIYQNGVILAGFSGDDAGWQTARIKPPVKAKWGHAIALIGFNKDYIIFQNSWSENWGEKGIGYIPKNYSPFESWSILVDLPDDFVTEEPKHFFAQDLKSGNRNKEVVWLQKCLKYAGIFPQIIKPAGYFGKVTFRSVQAFQAMYN
ncbi:MAG: hypothetical protein NTY61_01305, partial [Candidatus Parcubacteria bacterium]|nr:hypothetical protein [Candidatus Parcubacteria bacterium]